jgi:glycosyltransferase involved in cell wall biosynthesis
MSVFNGEPFVAEAVESVLNQTFGDFEFIIIDDGSTDGTAEILSRYRKIDSRVAVREQTNRGQVPSLNSGCALACGRYIARMDADDIALPERLERQISYLEENPQVVLLGSLVDFIDASKRELAPIPFPTEDEGIKRWLFDLHGVPFSHPTVVFRTEAFRAVQGYRPAFAPAEDYDLLIRMAERWQLANFPAALLKMRRHSQSLSITKARQQAISVLASWAASKVRRAGGHDPVGPETPVTRDLLRRMGVSDAVFEEHLMGIFQYWINVMLQSADTVGALHVIREALESQRWRHISRSILANTWLEAARIYLEQGRYVQCAASAARAFAVRPIIAGRPVKRLVRQMRLS